jgi:ABC-type branched-subunit amino acid transport system permease subunit
MPFIILLIVLLLIPARHFPRRMGSTQSLVRESQVSSPVVAGLRSVTVVLALALVPTFAGTRLPAWTAGLTYVILFASLGLLVWTSGQISLCHSAFAAVGVCAMAHLTAGHLPWALAVVLAGLVTVPVGALVAIPTIRLSGIYLALATLGFGILMQQVFSPTRVMFGADLTASAPRPHMGFIDGANDRHFYYVVLAATLLSLATVALIARSRLGRLLRAMSETPTMLITHGLGVNLTRLTVFCISAFFAGVAGALLVSQFGSSTASGYGPVQSLMFVAVLAICGTSLLRGAILAGGAFAVAPSYFTSFSVDRQTLIFGVVALLASLYMAYRDRIATFIDSRAALTSHRWTRSARPPRAHAPAAARADALARVVARS